MAKQYLYRIQPTRPGMLADGPTAEEGRHVSEHFRYLQNLTGEGAVLLAGRTLNTDESSFGIVIFRAESDDIARGIMEADPVVKAGVFKAELFPYSVSLRGNMDSFMDKSRPRPASGREGRGVE